MSVFGGHGASGFVQGMTGRGKESGAGSKGTAALPQTTYAVNVPPPSNPTTQAMITNPQPTLLEQAGAAASQKTLLGQ
jgi:hypothetical protein